MCVYVCMCVCRHTYVCIYVALPVKKKIAHIHEKIDVANEKQTFTFVLVSLI